MAGNRSDGFGEWLRAAREARGVPLRRIAERTKISVAALEALERNDFSHLPGGIFSRAFVRSYAIEIGLDPDTAIEKFLAEFPQGGAATPGQARSAQIEDGETLESERRMAVTLFKLIGFSLPIIGAVLYFSGGVRQSASRPPAREEPQQAEAVGVPAGSVRNPTPAPVVSPDAVAAVTPAPQGSPAAASATVAAASRSAAPPIAPSDRLTVDLLASAPCWISVTVDGTKSFERLLQPGDQRTLEVRRELVLHAGDAAAISLKVNGASAKPLGKPGQVVTARLNLSNFKDYLSTQ